MLSNKITIPQKNGSLHLLLVVFWHPYKVFYMNFGDAYLLSTHRYDSQICHSFNSQIWFVLQYKYSSIVLYCILGSLLSALY